MDMEDNYKRLHLEALKENGVYINNSDFGKVALSGRDDHRYWLMRKDGYQSELLFIKLGDFYVTYAGDAVRSAIALKNELGIDRTPTYKVVTWGFPVHALNRYRVYLPEPNVFINRDH